MLTFYGRASGSTRMPRHILYMYIVPAGRLKMLPGKKNLKNGQLRGLLWQALGHTGLSPASLSMCCGVLLEVLVLLPVFEDGSAEGSERQEEGELSF